MSAHGARAVEDVAFDVLHRLAVVLLAHSGESVVLVEDELRRAAAAIGSDLELLPLPEPLVLSAPLQQGGHGNGVD